MSTLGGRVTGARRFSNNRVTDRRETATSETGVLKVFAARKLRLRVFGVGVDSSQHRDRVILT